jgi:hypothetical protein
MCLIIKLHYITITGKWRYSSTHFKTATMDGGQWYATCFGMGEASSTQKRGEKWIKYFSRETYRKEPT